MRVLVLFCAVFLGSSALCAQSTGCKSYEPSVEILVGVVERDTFPGPPNYESVASGDRPEVCWVLKLPSPICMQGREGDDIDVSEDNIREIQVVFQDASSYKRYSKLVGHKVRVTGTLFHQMSGHHHTLVLVQVQAMVAA